MTLVITPRALFISLHFHFPNDSVVRLFPSRCQWIPFFSDKTNSITHCVALYLVSSVTVEMTLHA